MARRNTTLPVPNSLTWLWLSEPHELDSHRTTASLPPQTDIAIIGAVYAGVATAWHLMKETTGQDINITILEARGACSGATGRNGGHLRPDMYGHIPKYIARSGLKAGAEVAEFEIENMWALKKVIEEEGLVDECELMMARSVDVWCEEGTAEQAKETYERLSRTLGMEHMRDVLFTSEPAVAEAYSGVKGALAASSFTAGTPWPSKFILGLLKKLLETGRVNLQTHTPVLSVQADEKQGFAVETERGTVFARRVVHASNGYVSGVLHGYERNIIPCKGICSHIEMPKQYRATAPLFTNSYGNRTANNTLAYLIPRLDGSIIWCRTIDDSTLIESVKDYFADYMQRTYRGWVQAGARVSRIWTGIMGYSFDSNPHIGAVPSRPGQFILAGFNDHGMPVIWLGAKRLAKMIVADRERAETLPFSETGVPRLFQTSQARIDRAWRNSEEDGDIRGTGQIFLPTIPRSTDGSLTSKM